MRPPGRRTPPPNNRDAETTRAQIASPPSTHDTLSAVPVNSQQPPPHPQLAPPQPQPPSDVNTSASTPTRTRPPGTNPKTTRNDRPDPLPRSIRTRELPTPTQPPIAGTGRRESTGTPQPATNKGNENRKTNKPSLQAAQIDPSPNKATASAQPSTPAHAACYTRARHCGSTQHSRLRRSSDWIWEMQPQVAQRGPLVHQLVPHTLGANNVISTASDLPTNKQHDAPLAPQTGQPNILRPHSNSRKRLRHLVTELSSSSLPWRTSTPRPSHLEHIPPIHRAGIKNAFTQTLNKLTQATTE